MMEPISRSAEIGADTQLGFFCVIGENVSIGAGCRIGHHVVIHADTVIGDGVRSDGADRLSSGDSIRWG